MLYVKKFLSVLLVITFNSDQLGPNCLDFLKNKYMYLFQTKALIFTLDVLQSNK